MTVKDFDKIDKRVNKNTETINKQQRHALLTTNKSKRCTYIFIKSRAIRYTQKYNSNKSTTHISCVFIKFDKIPYKSHLLSGRKIKR